jgi:outer membrane lipoprotein-sorting protein
MNSKIITLLLIIASLLSIGWTDSFEGIRAAAGKIQSIEADFVQEKHMRILARPLISRGHFIYKTPASLRWEYSHPMQRVMLMHKGDVRRFLQSENGWVEDTANNLQSMDFVLQEISNWLNGRFDENPMFEASLASGGKIVLTPKESGMDQFIQRIEMVMADQPGIMKEVLIYESSDSFTRFKFITPKINQPLAEALFQKVQ